MENNMIFSSRLKEAMKHNNQMKQSELSKITGISIATLSRYMNGSRTPKVSEIVKLTKALNVSSDYLLGLDDDMNGKEKHVIDVRKALKLCEEAADGWHDFQMKALDNIGKGDGFGHSFGAVAYGAEQEQMYRWEIPNILRRLSDTKDIKEV